MGNAKNINNGYSFTFQPIVNVPQKYLSAAALLSAVGFTIPAILPLGDNVPFDVPIVIVKRENDNSQVSICRNKCVIAFDTEVNVSDIQLVIDAVYNFLTKLLDSMDALLYFGINICQQFVSERAVELVKEKYSLNDTEICDYDVSYTNLVDCKYYLNTKIANTRVYDSVINTSERGFLNIPSKPAVNVLIDVNNRYVFNAGITIHDYNKDYFLRVLKEIEQIAEKKLMDIALWLEGSD